MTSSTEELIRQLEYTLGPAKEEDLPYLSFDEEIRTRYLHHVEIKHDVETAIERNRFEVWYQPIYNRATNSFDTAACSSTAPSWTASRPTSAVASWRANPLAISTRWATSL